MFNTFTWVVGGTLFVVIVGLAIARFADGMRGEKVAKSLIFIPAAISLAGAGIIWKFIYAGPPFEVGLANQVAGRSPGCRPASAATATRSGSSIATSAPSTRRHGAGLQHVPAGSSSSSGRAGLATVIFSAAIKGVPDSLIEAAKVDGATNRQVFYKVTLPYISATVVTVATITAIAALKVFDIVAATTGGNFGTSTIANEFYRVYFVQGRNGFGSACAVLCSCW